MAAAGVTVGLTSSATTLTLNQPVTFTATVAAAQRTGTPTGFVTFRDGSTSLGTVPLSGGQAALTVPNLAVGGHSITAVYTGDATFSPGTSALAENVIPDVTSLVRVTPNKIKRVGRNRFRESVTLRNTSPNATIPVPIELVLDNLAKGVSLSNAAGTTHMFPPLGSPFVVVNQALAPGASAAVTLNFQSKSAKGISFTPRVLAGTSQI